MFTLAFRKKFARYFSYLDFLFYLTFVILISVYLRINLPIYNNVPDRDGDGCPIIFIDKNITYLEELYYYPEYEWMIKSRVWPFLVSFFFRIFDASYVLVVLFVE